MSLPPVFYHYFRRPLPYVQALVLQEKIHAIQNSLRRTPKFKDILLLLEHRPVYTAGRRQTEDTVQDDRIRLTRMGADFVTTTRGGQLTYHGPGQLVGYPFLDLSSFSPTMGAKDYVCRMQKMLERHLNETHGIESSPSEHTGIFLDPTTKIASIGVQVRHRLTSHGFAMNITREPLSWFEKIVACGLDDVRAGCVESAIGKAISVSDEIPGIVKMFGQSYQRDMEALIPGEDGQIYEAIREMENAAEQAKHWSREPLEQVQ